jgi:hypothetical protein
VQGHDKASDISNAGSLVRKLLHQLRGTNQFVTVQ